ncbi:MAG TPA: hypothetical protein VGG48_07125 [Rhizomicrobium sp.]|jgi:hypothetical protein
MSLTDLASIASLISSIAVFVSLVYLGLQIQQGTKHSRALIQQGRAARITESAFRIAELRESDGITRCFSGERDVDPNEIGRFLNICRAIFVSAEDSFLQHQEGLLNGLAFESFEASVRTGIGTAGIAAGWLMTRDMYGPEFRAYMDGMLGDMNVTPGAPMRSLQAWNTVLDELAARPGLAESNTGVA